MALVMCKERGLDWALEVEVVEQQVINPETS